MNIRKEMNQKMYELVCNENLYPELDEASGKMVDLCSKYFPKEKEDDYLDALFTVERKAFTAGVNMVLDFMSWKGDKHE